ncbi:MAG: LysR family transcriptional regulator [Pseudomonadota bacterium]
MLRELETFLAIARYGTFSAAGEHIGLTQSAVSAQIKRLEEGLQTTLFQRSGRTAQLNDAGHALLSMAREILVSFEDMRQRLQSDQPRGMLRIGAIPSVQVGLLPDTLVDFREEFPNVEIQIHPGTSTQLLDRLDVEELDLVVVIRPPFDLPKQLHWRPLLSEPYVLIAPPGVREKTPAQVLENHPFIRYDRLSYGGRPVQRFLKEQRIAVKDSMELKELEAIVRMVERGLGVSIIPHAGLLGLQKRKLQLMPLAPTFYREIGIVEHGADARSPSITAFTACLEKISGKTAPQKTRPGGQARRP